MSYFRPKKGGHLKILVEKGGPVIYYSGIHVMIIATTGSKQGSKFN